MREPEYKNVILDTHPYQCFTDDDRKRDLHGQVQHRPARTQEAAGRHATSSSHALVGEWSCALPPESLGGRTGLALDLAMRAYGDAS